MENPTKIHDLGVPLFLETPIFLQIRKGFQTRDLPNILYKLPKLNHQAFG